MKDQFDWQKIGEDDFICTPNKDYSLRVVQMAKFTWWWAVYFNGNQIFTEKPNILKCSKYYAMGLCEGVYLGHYISTR